MFGVMSYFAIAVAVALILYYALPKRVRWIALLVASVLFYGVTSTYMSVFVLTTAVGVYFGARAIGGRNDRLEEACKAVAAEADGGGVLNDTERLKTSAKRKNKAVIVCTVVFNLGLLAFLKYYNFFGSSLCSLLTLMGAKIEFRSLDLILPMGISFYTLSAIGYMTDVHRKKYAPEKNFFKILLFLAFFPTVMEGPICRYDQNAPSIFEGHDADYKGMAHGAQRILWGIFKKLVVADRLFVVVDKIAGSALSVSGVASLIFILGYTIQLYADFSGFTDIALGTAELFGVKLPENFRQPFFAKSAQEFWQRWHITLGAWLKEYVFYSVALSPAMMKFSKRIKKKHKNHFTKILPTGIALLCVWLCNGLWHGPQWNYIVYGLYYFVIIFGGMLFEPLFGKLYKKLKIDKNALGLRIFRHVRTLLIILVGETLFGARSVGDALHILGYLFVPYGGSVVALGLAWYEYVVLLFGVAAIFAVDILKERGINLRDGIDALRLPLRWGVYIAAVAIVVVFGAYGSAYTSVPFMYGNF